MTVAVSAASWPSGLARFRPGPARPVEPLVTIPDDRRADPPDPDSFYLTSVYIDENVGWGEAILTWLRDRESLAPLEDVRPSGVSDEEQNRVNLQMLNESELAAKVVALRAAGFDVPLQGEGVEVAAVAPDSAAAGQLQKDDIITAIDGRKVETIAELVPQIRGSAPGTTLALTVVRQGEPEPRTITVTTKPAADAPGESRIGIAALTYNLRFDLPFPVEFNVSNLGGGSAGLMFALTIYDEITPGDLNHGIKVAGTGTISPEGEVGPIGGVRGKVLSAESVGARYFLAPLEDAEEAKAVAKKLTVIPVGTFEEARAALEKLAP